MRRLVAIAVTVGLAATGCKGVYQMVGGYSVSPLADSERAGAAFGVHLDAGADYDPVLGGVSLRSKVMDDLLHFATGFEVLAPLAEDDLTPYLRVGLHLLQFESIDGGFAFGMGTPYAELGALYFFGHGNLISLSVGYEYTVRFSSDPNEDYLSIVVGVGLGDL